MGGIRKFKENYIPVSGTLSRNQKNLAKEAIIRLLSQRMHSLADIAEHFGLPLDVVALIIKDMERKGRVVKEEKCFKLLR